MDGKSFSTDTRTVQAVIFDLDGVLMDSEWMAFGIWQNLAARHGGALDDSAFPAMVGLTAEETAEFVMRLTGITFDVAEGCAWAWEQVIERIKHAPEALPGAHSLVQTLAAQGYPLAIASNSPTDYIDHALTGLGLADAFPVRVGIDQVSQGKPAPDVYLHAAWQVGIPPSQCLAIEDSRVGVLAAAAAGMRVLAVPGKQDHPHGFQHAWRVYESLEHLHETLHEALRLE